jgi:RimJ/RimL family protein N-acetyltransferase
MDALIDLCPLFGLLIETPRLCLRVPREADLPSLARAARSIAETGEPQFQLPWMYEPSPVMEQQLLRRYWHTLADWEPGRWHLLLGIFAGGHAIGMQSLWASDFSRLRSVGTGSWISRAEQRRGYGTEARAAVLGLAFGELGAEEARTEYLDGNLASERVSRKLHYVDNGRQQAYRPGLGRITEHRMRLDRGTWLRETPRGQCVITGAEPCLGMFGLAEA